MSVEMTQPPSSWQRRARELLDVPIQLVRDFVWADVRAGLVDVRGLDAPTRFLVVVGFVLLVGTVLALLFNETWREQFDLVAQSNGVVGRGTLVPDALMPVTFFLIAVAWAYGLAGALHSHWLVRVFIVAVYLLFAAGWLNTTGALSPSAAPGLLVSGADWESGLLLLGVAAVPVIFVVRARRAMRPAWEWLALFVCTASFFALIQARGLAIWREYEIPVIAANLQNNLVSFQSLVAPLLLLAGVNVALFANQAARWTTEMAKARLPRRWLAVALFLVIGLREIFIVGEVVERVRNEMLTPMWSALGVFVIIGAAYVLVRRLSAGRTFVMETLVERVRGVALWWILATGAISLLGFVTVTLVQIVPPQRAWDGVRETIWGVTDFLQTQVQEPWFLLVCVLMLGAGVWVARRGQREVALYLLITGGLALWYSMLVPGQPLAALGPVSAPQLDFLIMLVVVGLTVFWAVRNTLTSQRMAGLFFLAVLSWLVRQTDFISSPFSPFLGFAGIGFVAFGILYDAVTAGVWTNSESPGFPRVGRIFLYLGYVVLSVMIVNWALASHDLNNIEKLTGSVAWQGMVLFGLPFVYAVGVMVVSQMTADGG